MIEGGTVDVLGVGRQMLAHGGREIGIGTVRHGFSNGDVTRCGVGQSTRDEVVRMYSLQGFC
jgi:hypothetical protein